MSPTTRSCRRLRGPTTSLRSATAAGGGRATTRRRRPARGAGDRGRRARVDEAAEHVDRCRSSRPRVSPRRLARIPRLAGSARCGVREVARRADPRELARPGSSRSSQSQRAQRTSRRSHTLGRSGRGRRVGSSGRGEPVGLARAIVESHAADDAVDHVWIYPTPRRRRCRRGCAALAAPAEPPRGATAARPARSRACPHTPAHALAHRAHFRSAPARGASEIVGREGEAATDLRGRACREAGRPIAHARSQRRGRRQPAAAVGKICSTTSTTSRPGSPPRHGADCRPRISTDEAAAAASGRAAARAEAASAAGGRRGGGESLNSRVATFGRHHAHPA